MYIKKSKSYNNMWKYKSGLVDENERYLEEEQRIRTLYMTQPRRTMCKLCGSSIKKRRSIEIGGVEYFVCDICGHINGVFEDGEPYCKALYENEQSDYGGDYHEIDEKAFLERVDTIYDPKVVFLMESIGDIDIRLLDVGAGVGHFVKAALLHGIEARGIDVDAKSIAESHRFLEKERMKHIGSKEICSEIRHSQENVISFIYSLEHIVNLREVLSEVQKNDNIQYLYFSVPVESFSMVFSAACEGVSDRLFGGGTHAHIFSRESIEWLTKYYGFTTVARWDFGADIADMLRILMIRLSKTNNSSYASYVMTKLSPLVDKMQEVVDNDDWCSDIHILLRKV